MRTPQPTWSLARELWLEQLLAGPTDWRGKGRTAYDCRANGWTEWNSGLQKWEATPAGKVMLEAWKTAGHSRGLVHNGNRHLVSRAELERAYVAPGPCPDSVLLDAVEARRLKLERCARGWRVSRSDNDLVLSYGATAREALQAAVSGRPMPEPAECTHYKPPGAVCDEPHANA